MANLSFVCSYCARPIKYNGDYAHIGTGAIVPNFYHMGCYLISAATTNAS